ncbi:MAG: hypothetical protein FWG13_03780 [Leptospirales bacterium]|nr:hypothetical protein [Leptospirales bacterium]
MRYFLIVFLMTLFVIGLVWQNVEVVKIKLEYRKLNQLADDLYKERDLLLYKLESGKNIDFVREQAAGGYKELRPDDIAVVVVDEKNRNEDK